MKILGMIGGTSWHSTIEYYREINKSVGNEIGHQANPELILYSINIELMREHNIDKIQKKYLERALTPWSFFFREERGNKNMILFLD